MSVSPSRTGFLDLNSGASENTNARQGLRAMGHGPYAGRAADARFDAVLVCVGEGNSQS